MRLDPVVQGLLNHSQAAGYRRHRLARLHKSNRLLLELKRVTTTRCLRHLRVPFAIKAACYGIRFAGARSNRPSIKPTTPSKTSSNSYKLHELVEVFLFTNETVRI